MKMFRSEATMRLLPVRYRFGSEQVPVVSVTQVIDLCGYGTDYSRIPVSVLTAKAGVGNAIHRIAAGVESIADLVTVDDRMVEGYRRVLADTRATVLWSESSIVRSRYGGTRDQAWLVGDRNVLVDLKSRPLNPCADPVQLAGYADLEGGVAYSEHWIVELNTTSRGYKVHTFDPLRHLPQWRTALDHVLYLYAHGKWAFTKGE